MFVEVFDDSTAKCTSPTLFISRLFHTAAYALPTLLLHLPHRIPTHLFANSILHISFLRRELAHYRKKVYFWQETERVTLGQGTRMLPSGWLKAVDPNCRSPQKLLCGVGPESTSTITRHYSPEKVKNELPRVKQTDPKQTYGDECRLDPDLSHANIAICSNRLYAPKINEM